MLQYTQAAQTSQHFTARQRVDNLLFFKRRFSGRNIQLVARRGGKTPKPAAEIFRLANHLDHHAAQAFQFILFYPSRMFAAGQIRIAVVLAAEIVFQRIIGKAADQIAAVWPTEADGVVQRRFVSDSVVRESGRNVQNIARLQILINDRRERVNVQQRRMRAELTIGSLSPTRQRRLPMP